LRAATGAQGVQSLLAGAAVSKLRLRDQPLFAKSVATMALHHGAETVQVPGDVLQTYLFHIDPAGPDLLHQMPSAQAQLPGAIAKGGPVAIPVPEFMQALAGSQTAPLLALHVKPTADAPSLAELAQQTGPRAAAQASSGDASPTPGDLTDATPSNRAEHILLRSLNEIHTERVSNTKAGTGKGSDDGPNQSGFDEERRGIDFGATTPAGEWHRSNIVRDDISVIRQKDLQSCGYACGAMVLRDRGVIVAPEVIGSGFSSFQRTAPDNLGIQLGKVAPHIKWAVGQADDLAVAFDILTRRAGGSWIAELKGTGKVSHAVVVDALATNGLVHIRDPWDQTSYTMTKDDFMSHWTGGFVGQ
jgi:hypothetical protein